MTRNWLALTLTLPALCACGADVADPYTSLATAESALAADDFDGDGIPDDADSCPARVFHGFEAVETQHPTARTVADLNGDGAADIVSFSRVHLGGADGVAAERTPLSEDGYVPYGYPLDLDGNGSLDSHFVDHRTDETRIVFVRNDYTRVVEIDTNIPTGPWVGGAHTLRFADFDGDGDLDAFFRRPDQVGRLYEQTSFAQFTDRGEAPHVMSGSTIPADIDGDGDTDLVLGDHIYFATAPFVFERGPEFQVPPRFRGLRDINADGIADIVRATSAAIGDGAGNFAEVALALPEMRFRSAFGDVDADGRLEWVVVTQGGDVWVHWLDSQDRYIPVLIGTQVAYSAGTPVVADFTGDGNPDILMQTSGDDHILLRNLGHDRHRLAGSGQDICDPVAREVRGLAPMCPAGMPVVHGTEYYLYRGLEFFGGPEDECIVGTELDDLIDGGGGADVIFGRGDDDDIWGGSVDEDGDDVLVGGAGDDTLRGFHGADVLLGGAGNDRLFACDSDHTVCRDGVREWLDGGPGRDIIHMVGDDIALGGGGNDDIYAHGDTLDRRGAIVGDGGRDTIRLLGRGYDVCPGTGADRIRGNQGAHNRIFRGLSDEIAGPMLETTHVFDGSAVPAAPWVANYDVDGDGNGGLYDWATLHQLCEPLPVGAGGVAVGPQVDCEDTNADVLSCR